MVKAIPHNRPWIMHEDEEAVLAVMKSGHIAQGPEVEGLESDFVSLIGRGKACVLSSGSAGLFLALYGLRIGKGEKVAVPTYACSALLNAVHMTGAEPIVVDVTDDTFTLDPARVSEQAPKADAAIVVHCYGASADVEGLSAQNIKVVEDCCHTVPGGKGRPGNVSVYSFYATKIITGGNGGLIWDASGEITERARDYRQHDCRDEYIPRFNFQMADFQAAMVRSQLSRLGIVVSRRRKIYELYKSALPAEMGVQSGLSDPSRTPYRFVVRTQDQETRDRLRRHMSGHGITSIIPIERFELLHRYLGLDAGAYPNAEKIVDTTLSLPLYPALSDEEVNHVANALSDFK